MVRTIQLLVFLWEPGLPSSNLVKVNIILPKSYIHYNSPCDSYWHNFYLHKQNVKIQVVLLHWFAKGNNCSFVRYCHWDSTWEKGTRSIRVLEIICLPMNAKHLKKHVIWAKLVHTVQIPHVLSHCPHMVYSKGRVEKQHAHEEMDRDWQYTYTTEKYKAGEAHSELLPV